MAKICFEPTPLSELFPDEDYRVQMRFTRGQPAVFFGPTAGHAALVSERQRWLRDSPEIFSALLPDGERLLHELSDRAEHWHGFHADAGASNLPRCRALGGFWETDFLLLKPDNVGAIRLVGGCLCFPSHWRLTDKIGQPMEFIHGPVPGLNENLGASIHKFLITLKPGTAWQRVNWGLSRSPELNQHPDRSLPRLDASVRLDEVWLRVEEQALVGLPESGGILFGIRIVNRPLAKLRDDEAVAVSFCRALETMPESLARYKGIATARSAIVALVRS